MMKDQTTPALFMQSEAANILGLPNSLVKNWTIGRPLEINPSIAARGTGSRNLYDQRDLYRLAIAAQLSADGVAPRAIQIILDDMGVDFLASRFVIVVGGSGSSGHLSWKKREKLQVRPVPSTLQEREVWNLIHEAVKHSFGCYILNTREITESVDHLTQEFLRRSTKLVGQEKGTARRAAWSGGKAVAEDEHPFNTKRKIKIRVREARGEVHGKAD
jgi:hypothetical protein